VCPATAASILLFRPPPRTHAPRVLPTRTHLGPAGLQRAARATEGIPGRMVARAPRVGLDSTRRQQARLFAIRAPRGRLRMHKGQQQNQRAVPVRQANTLPWAPHHARTAAETGSAQLLPGLVRHVQPAQLPVIRAILPEILPVLLATPVSTRHHRTAGTATNVELANIKSPVARRIARPARRANPRLSWPQQAGRFV
jgi:hypothetical protein